MENTFEARLLKARGSRNLSVFNLCSIDDFTLEDIQLVFDLAKIFKENGNRKYALLRDVAIFNAFFEDSTRTRSSFELAGKQLAADVINVSSKDTSIKKKETLHDTAETLSAMRPNVIVVRTSKAGIPFFLSKHIRAAIINAGDGWHEHPTQSLLDAFTMIESLGDLKKKKVVIVGDLLHSRVFGSLVRLLPRLGAEVRVSAPATLIPKEVEKVFKCKAYLNLEEAIQNVDVVYALRVQEERGAGGFIPTLREYSKNFGITAKRLAMAKKEAILMHPGPVIRDIDVHSALVNQPQSRILAQVENGLAIRSALLWLYGRRTDERWKEYKLI